MHATMEKNCVENILIAHPILQALFTFLQMHFLFVNSQVSFLSIFFWPRAWLDSAVLKEACPSGPDLNLIQPFVYIPTDALSFCQFPSKFFILFIFDRELDISKFFWPQAWLDSAVLKEPCSSGPYLNLIQLLFTFLQRCNFFCQFSIKFFWPPDWHDVKVSYYLRSNFSWLFSTNWLSQMKNISNLGQIIILYPSDTFLPKNYHGVFQLNILFLIWVLRDISNFFIASLT